MKYVVIRYFTDAQDNEHPYREGDIYPREGLTVSDARLKDLLSGNNFQRIPLIKRVTATQEKKAAETTEKTVWTADEIQKMPYMKLKSVAKQNGVELEGKDASEIRTELIEKLVEE